MTVNLLHSTVGILLLSIAFSSLAQICNETSLIKFGDTAATVLGKCGEPLQRQVKTPCTTQQLSETRSGAVAVAESSSIRNGVVVSTARETTKSNTTTQTNCVSLEEWVYNTPGRTRFLYFTDGILTGYKFK